MPGAVKTLAVAYGVAASPRWRGWRRGGGERAARSGTPAPSLAGAPATLARRPDRFAFNNGAVGVEMRDGRGAAFVMGDERGGFPIDLFRRPLDPLQARGHFFYLCEDGDAPWSIGFEPTRRAGDYRIEEPASIASHRQHGQRARARMEIAPDPARRGPELAHPAGEPVRPGAPATPRQLLRNRRPRDRRLRARSRFRRHACRDHLRSRAQRHSRAQPAVCARRAPIAAKPRSSPSSPGPAAEARRLRGFAHALPRRRLARQADWLRAVALAQARRRRQAVDLRSRGELHARGRACRHGERPRRSSSSAAPTTRYGRANWSRARLGLRASAGAGAADGASTRRAPSSRRQRCLRAGRSPSRRTARRCSLTHRTPRPWAHVMANELGMATMVSNDGEIYSAFGNARQNGLTPFRFDSVTDVAAGPDRLYPRPRHRRDRRARLRAVPARGRDLRGDLRAGRRDLRHDARRSDDRPRRFRSARLSRRHAAPDPAQSRRRLHAPARRAVLRHRARGKPERERRQDRDETVGATLLFQNPATISARHRLRRDEPAPAGDRDHPRALLRRARARHPHARDGRDRRDRRFRNATTDAASPPSRPRSRSRPAAKRRSRSSSARRRRARERSPPPRAAASQTVEAALAATRASWAERLGKSRSAPTGPTSIGWSTPGCPISSTPRACSAASAPTSAAARSAIRDQLQDVLPLILIEPRLTRAQIVLHAASSSSKATC